MMTKADLPRYLQKYIVEQNYERYTAIDQSVWRYVIRQLKSFLSVHAHACYLKGMDEIGITENEIPRIENISRRLNKIGWNAMPVSGFIPPAAFMELQALHILPIASDMRSMEHLLYTPAPDIVHEAAGHAPMLVDPEFAAYLRHYAEISRRAIISKEDLDVYTAIRQLSDLKENPNSTKSQIEYAEKHLQVCIENVSHVSEATQLSRLNWWTNEYGLIGSLTEPKIYGAGLLSSVGESQSCLSPSVKKIPFSIECINQSYDITEPQPQLYVTPSFSHLAKVLDEFALTMAFKKGGLPGLITAVKAQSVNTARLNSEIEVSGLFVDPIIDEGQQLIYLKTTGPTQLSYQGMELIGHSKSYHAEGFGTPVGPLKEFPNRCPSTLSDSDWQKIGLMKDKKISLEFQSGVLIEGEFSGSIKKNNKTLVLSFVNATATYTNQVLFQPSWGNYDIILGSSITSVYGGPADREAYGPTEDFDVHTVPTFQYSPEEIYLQNLFSQIRSLREQKSNFEDYALEVEKIYRELELKYPNNWLLRLECYELLHERKMARVLADQILESLNRIGSSDPKCCELINSGINLVHR